LANWQLTIGSWQLKEAVMFRKLLVPLDGSQLAANALPSALALAQASDGLVLLLRVPVYQKQSLPAKVTAVYNRLRPPEEKEWVRHRVERYLRSVRLVTLGREIAFETLVIDGDPAGVIVDTAEAQDVDLIVMSTHGRGGLVRWWLGSVTEKVLRATTRPILIVSSDKLPTRTLVTLDGSTAAEAALEPARYMADTLGTPLYLLRVLEPLEMAEDDPDISSQEAADLNNRGGTARRSRLPGSYQRRFARHPLLQSSNLLETAISSSSATVADLAARKVIRAVLVVWEYSNVLWETCRVAKPVLISCHTQRLYWSQDIHTREQNR
jgi:nucleotide-binding universal stress UspA family protein